ncbi:hypothetical protein A2U01_0059749, partial [Trifolium medium]|nr:hypothetical protein [Trifolium medium]
MVVVLATVDSAMVVSALPPHLSFGLTTIVGSKGPFIPAVFCHRGC